MSEIALSRWPRRRIFGGVPCVEMGVKVKYCNRTPIDLSKSFQSWKGNTMVSSQGEQLRLRTSRMYEGWRTGAKLKESFTHLLNGESIIEWGNGNVATVNYGVRGAVWIQATTWVETTKGSLTSRGCTNGSRPKACSWWQGLGGDQ